MKKVLLASSVLALSATVAAAEVTLSGEAGAGVRRTAGADFSLYNGIKLTFGGATETDGGVSFSVSADLKSGTNVDLDDIKNDDPANNGLGAPKVTVSGAFGTITMKNNGVDHLYSDDDAGDFGYAYSAGDLSLGLTYDLEGSALSGDWSASAGYKVGDLSVSVAADDMKRNKIVASYSMNGVTATVESNDSNAAERTNSIKVAYSANGFSGSIKYASGTDANTKTTVGLGYTMDALSISSEFVSKKVGANDWKVYGSYDLGNGAAFVAGANKAKNAYAGVKFSF